MKSIIIIMMMMVLVNVNVFAEEGTTTGQQKQVEAEGKLVIVIGSFANKSSGDDKIFQTLIDRIKSSIVNTRKFDVIERARLGELQKEKELAEAGVTEGKRLDLDKKVKSAGFKIYGTVLSLGVDSTSLKTGGMSAEKMVAKVELQLEFSNVENGKVEASKIIKATESASQTAGKKTEKSSNMAEQVLNEAVATASKKVVAELMNLAYPPKIISVSRRSATVNLTQEQTEKGAIYEVKAMGKELIDPDTGESLGQRESMIGEVTVISVMPKMAEVKPIDGLLCDDLDVGMILRRVSDEELNQRSKEKVQNQKKRILKRF